jgi:acetyltransferase
MSIPETAPRYAISHCAIPHYATTLIDVWRSPRGEQFVLRPILPQDVSMLQDFYASLSPRSRRLRFHGAVNGLSAQALAQLCEGDLSRHLMLVVTFVSEGVETIVAEARYVVDETLRGGEFAIAVSDVWQRRGIAARAIEGLCKAARLQGLDWLWGEVLEGNAAMLELMTRAGFYRSSLGPAGIVRVERSVARAHDQLQARSHAPSRNALGLLAHWLFGGGLYA